MRRIDNDAIRAAGDIRFRSEYDYAVFEYVRSSKVIQSVERSGVRLRGRVLDAGCGSGGTALSIAEEVSFAVGLDLSRRFSDSGTRLAREKRIENVAFTQGDGLRLPYASDSFDVVLSHSVIEHLPSAETYIAECARVLKPGGGSTCRPLPPSRWPARIFPGFASPFPSISFLGRKTRVPGLRVSGRESALDAQGEVERQHFRKARRVRPREGRRSADPCDLARLFVVDRAFSFSARFGRTLRQRFLQADRPCVPAPVSSWRFRSWAT